MQRSKGRCERRPVVFATGNDFKTGVVDDNTNNGVKKKLHAKMQRSKEITTE